MFMVTDPSSGVGSKDKGGNDSGKENNTTPGFADLFRTIDNFDQELGEIKHWLLEKEVNIRQLTEDYRDIEEKNSRLNHSCLSSDDSIPTTTTSISNTETLYMP